MRLAKLVASGLLLASGLAIGTAESAKADLFCYPWESDCRTDGIIGTSTVNPYEIKVRNSCNRDLVAHLEVIPYGGGNEWGDRDVSVKSGARVAAALTSNAIFYISAESADGDLTWPRKEVRMEGTDYTYNLTCRNS